MDQWRPIRPPKNLLLNGVETQGRGLHNPVRDGWALGLYKLVESSTSNPTPALFATV